MVKSLDGLEILIISISSVVLNAVSGCQVKIYDDSPAVIGSTVTFYSSIVDASESDASNRYKFKWSDNAIPQNTAEFEGAFTSTKWNVTYSSPYGPGEYEVQIVVYKKYAFFPYMPVCSQRKYFTLTGYLKGNIKLKQNSTERVGFYVASESPTTHEIKLSGADENYLKSNASSVVSYWFVDCEYRGFTPNLSYTYTYAKPNEEHVIRALVVASHTPIKPKNVTANGPPNTDNANLTDGPHNLNITDTPNGSPNLSATDSSNGPPNLNATDSPNGPPNLNTTDSPNGPPNLNTTDSPNGSPNLNATDSLSIPLNSPSTTNITNLASVSVLPKKGEQISRTAENTLAPEYASDFDATLHDFFARNYNSTENNSTAMLDCINDTIIPKDGKKTYGFFTRRMMTKAPIKNLKFDGNVWLQHGDMLNLTIACNGSGPFTYCMKFHNGAYNVTGNEACQYERTSPTCRFMVYHYFPNSTEYTLVIILKNDVSKLTQPIGINVYYVQKRAQLSVIIVPIAAFIVSVVLIIFGIAYYIQSKRSFTIEVANFDFTVASDMECKTFKERLMEAISNVFNKEEDEYSDDISSDAPSTSRKYGSMR